MFFDIFGRLYIRASREYGTRGCNSRFLNKYGTGAVGTAKHLGNTDGSSADKNRSPVIVIQ